MGKEKRNGGYMRIRTIKPEFWSHPVMGRQSDATKLLAIGLLNYADDDGYFHADPKLVRNAIRPFDDDSGIVTVAIRDLSKIGFLELRTHPTHGEIGFIPGFSEHQVINKPKPSKIKGLWDSGINTVSIPDAERLEGNRDQGMEQGKDCCDDRAELPDCGFTLEPPPPKATRARHVSPDAIRWTRETKWSGITEQDRSDWKAAFPACDIDRQLASMDAWLAANPAKAKKSNWRKFVTTWLTKSQDRGGDIASNKPRVNGCL